MIMGTGEVKIGGVVSQDSGGEVVPPSGDSGEAERSFRKESERHSGMIPNTIGA